MAKDRSGADWRDRYFGMAARGRGFVSDAQLLEALNLQILAQRHLGYRPPIGVILFLRGIIDAEHIRDVLAGMGVPLDGAQPAAPAKLLGQLMVECGYVTAEELLRCLNLQRSAGVESGPHRRPLGEILVEEGSVSSDQLQSALQLQKAAGATGAGMR